MRNQHTYAEELTKDYPVNEYKIIVVVGNGVAKHFNELRQSLCERHNIIHPATSTPQLILSHFWQVEEREQRLIERLRIIAKASPPLPLHFKGFGYYAPHTVFINLENALHVDNLLKKIRKDAGRLMLSKMGYKPGFMSNAHLTILRKLNKEIFESVQKDVEKRQFTGKYNASQMLLVRRRPEEFSYSPIESFVFENLPIETTQGLLFG